MALLAPISHGFLEDDSGAPGLYVTEAGVVVLRSTPAGPLVPVGGGGGAASPLVLTAGDATETPLTVDGAVGQTADLLDVNSDDATLSVGGNGNMNWYGVGTNTVIQMKSDIPGFDDTGVYLDSSFGSVLGTGDPAATPLQVQAKAAQTADIFQVRDASHALVLSVQADGSVHILTGGSVIADL